MKLKDISKEDLETMNYNDIAYLILKEAKKKKYKANELFREVCDNLGLSDLEYVNNIGDFFGMISTDKRFIMLEDGSWDLKELYNPKVIIDDDDDEDEDTSVDADAPEEDEEIFYDEDADDDMGEDDLDDFAIIDDEEEEAN